MSVYSASIQFGCEPWELGIKRLASWNRRHGWSSNLRHLKRQRELAQRERLRSPAHAQ
jgi:hypothetical protein